MDITEIKDRLLSEDMYDRLDAIKALKSYPENISLPLLLKLKQDDKFLVRSLVAMGLGKNKTAESFAALLEMMKLDRDTNVRAEASNSLSLFGEISIPHLQQAFYQDDAWLVRLSILAALRELNCPNELFDVCICGLKGEDDSVRENSISCLASFTKTNKEQEALDLLLSMVNSTSWRVRSRVVQALANFTNPLAQEAFNRLKQDPDPRVVKAASAVIIDPDNS